MGKQFHTLLDDYHYLNDSYRVLQLEHSELKREYEKTTNRLRSRRTLFTKNSTRLQELRIGLLDFQDMIRSDATVSRTVTDQLHKLVTDARLEDSIGLLQYFDTYSSILDW